MKDFKGKVVVITGGATGIGLEYAKALGKEGGKIIISSRNENHLKNAVNKLKSLDIEATYKVADVTQEDDVEELANFAWEKYGKVDVIINNAGMMIPQATVVDMPMNNINRIFAVNLFGVIIGSKVFGKRFIKQGTPSAIYNVGSENSLFHGVPLDGAYVATKHAVLAITYSLKEELPDFIDVSLICPGFVYTNLGPKDEMSMGMPVDEFIEKTLPQLKANNFYVVSHAYNIVRINQEHEMIDSAYQEFAPRYEGDIKYDVRTLVTPIAEKELGRELRKI